MAKQNWNFWKGVFAGWIVASIVAFVGYAVILGPAHAALEAQGIVRPEQGGPQAMIGWEVILLLAVYIMAEFLEKLAPAKHLNYVRQGAQFGILFSLPTITQYLFVPVPALVPAVATVTNLLAFMLAAWVYEKLAVPKHLRTAAVRKHRRR